jgi:carbonic anhydrase
MAANAGRRSTPKLKSSPGQAAGADSAVPGTAERPAGTAAQHGTQPQPADLARRAVVRSAGLAGLVTVGLAGARTSGLISASPISANTVAASTVAASTVAADTDAAAAHAPDPAAALRILMAGNLRWARGTASRPRQSVRRREQVAGHQSPFATVVCCIDSRVPPEIVFDAGLGDLFAIRTGAQTLDDQVVLGSVEFGPVNYSTAKLMFVLGHQSCGAVSAAIKVIEGGGRAPGHIQAVVNALRPAYRIAKPQRGDLLENMIRAQTRLTVHRLRRDPVLAKLNLLIVGGHYDLHTGVVKIIT